MWRALDLHLDPVRAIAIAIASAIASASGCTAPSPGGRPTAATPGRDPAAASARAETAPTLDQASAERFAALALSCVHREYPSKIAHVLRSAADAEPPSALTPAFYGCFDWHSAVHGHWMLARIARTFPGTAVATKARAALDESLTPAKIAAEVAYQSPPERDGFERPYGLAWLLQLCAELRGWDDPDARRWSAALRPLEALAVRRLSSWIPKLTHPIRIGEHAQTAFAFGLGWTGRRLNTARTPLPTRRARHVSERSHRSTHHHRLTGNAKSRTLSVYGFNPPILDRNPATRKTPTDRRGSTGRSRTNLVQRSGGRGRGALRIALACQECPCERKRRGLHNRQHGLWGFRQR